MDVQINEKENEKEKDIETVVPDDTTSEKKQIRLTDIPVTDENVALNIIISFLHLAQRRGAFTLDESAKIFECVKSFRKNE